MTRNEMRRIKLAAAKAELRMRQKQFNAAKRFLKQAKEKVRGYQAKLANSK